MIFLWRKYFSFSSIPLMVAPTNYSNRLPLADLIRHKLAEGVMLVGFFLLFVTVLFLAAQFFWYLKEGAWPNWVLFGFISSALPLPFLQWLTSPQDWHGLHTVIAWILLEAPLWVDTLAIALICVFSFDKIGKA